MQSAIPATLIGNWEIAGIRGRDVNRPDSITVIGHLEAARAKVTFVSAAFRPDETTENRTSYHRV